MIDPHTFGGTKASETLATILNTKYPKCIPKVSSYYHKYNRDLTNMVYAWKAFSGSGCLMELMQLHKHKRFDTVRNSTLPEEVKSFLLNVMNVSYGIKLKVIKNLLKHGI